MREAKQLARKLELQEVPACTWLPSPSLLPALTCYQPHPLATQLRSDAGDSGGSVIIMQLREDKEQADGEKAMLAERSRLLQAGTGRCLFLPLCLTHCFPPRLDLAPLRPLPAQVEIKELTRAKDDLERLKYEIVEERRK